MGKRQLKQLPLKLRRGTKTDVRAQFAALCWRIKNDKLQVCLITSRTRKRWIIPKGWPVDGATPVEAARREAWEEAGVTGEADPTCIGLYSYVKDLPKNEMLPCVVAIFPIKVRNKKGNWPEMHQRRRKWMTLKQAAKATDIKELSAILKSFDPRTP